MNYYTLVDEWRELWLRALRTNSRNPVTQEEAARLTQLAHDTIEAHGQTENAPQLPPILRAMKEKK